MLLYYYYFHYYSIIIIIITLLLENKEKLKYCMSFCSHSCYLSITSRQPSLSALFFKIKFCLEGTQSKKIAHRQFMPHGKYFTFYMHLSGVA
jgi:hypothetical protein